MKRRGMYILIPLLFLFIGYFTIYIIGAPVINFVNSTLQMVLLSDAPEFDNEYTDLFADEELRASVKKSTVSKKAGEQTAEQAQNGEGTQQDTAQPVEQATIPLSTFRYPQYGDRYGQIRIAKVGVDEPLFFGDSTELLSYGAGQYSGSMLPGEMGTTLVGGHNITSFGNIYYLALGDQITIETYYGNYTYQVVENRVALNTDATILNKLEDRSKDTVIFYTCYPLDALGLTDQRVFVTAEYVSGPLIDPNA